MESGHKLSSTGLKLPLQSGAGGQRVRSGHHAVQRRRRSAAQRSGHHAMMPHGTGGNLNKVRQQRLAQGHHARPLDGGQNAGCNA